MQKKLDDVDEQILTMQMLFDKKIKESMDQIESLKNEIFEKDRDTELLRRENEEKIDHIANDLNEQINKLKVEN
jgi:hypothetical protein